MTLDELDIHLAAGLVVELTGAPNPWSDFRVVERFGWNSLAGFQARYRMERWARCGWERQPVVLPSTLRAWLDRGNASVPGRPYAPGWKAHPNDPDAVGGAP